MRSLALVGGYLQHWAMMEMRLNDLLGKVLGLEKLAALVVSKNIQLRDKIKIVRTTIDMHYGFTEEQRAEYKSIIQKIGNLSDHRNMMAHDFFCASENGDGVNFFVVKAASKLELPDLNWSIEEFGRRYYELATLAIQIKKIADQLETADLIKALALAHERGEMPMQAFGSLTSASSLFQPTPEPPHSSPLRAMLGIDDETPLEPPETEE